MSSPDHQIQSPHVACLGAGAVGMSVLAKLVAHNVPAVAIGRKTFYRHLTQNKPSDHTVCVEGFGQKYNFEPVSKSHLDLSHLQCLFVTVQTYYLKESLWDIAHSLPPKTVVISLCNGRCDHILHQARQELNHLEFRLGVAFYNCTVVSQSQFICSNGHIVWGALTPHLPPCSVETRLGKCDDFFLWAQDIWPYYQKKWIMNTTSNSLSAAYGVQKARLVLDLYPDELDHVYDESVGCAQKLWGDLHFDTYELKTHMMNMLQNFGDLEISMHRHVRTGTPTETDFLAGQAQAWADEFPMLVKLHHLILNKSSVSMI